MGGDGDGDDRQNDDKLIDALKDNMSKSVSVNSTKTGGGGDVTKYQAALQDKV